MVNNINQVEQGFDTALHRLASLATTPAQLQAIEAVLLAREGFINTHIVETLGDVARFFGVAEQTCRTWRLRTDPMPGEPGAWDLSEIARWRIAAEQSKHRPRNENEALADIIGEPGGEDWKDRWLRAKALLTEEQLAEVQGQLVDLEELAPILMRTPLERVSEEVEAMVVRT